MVAPPLSRVYSYLLLQPLRTTPREHIPMQALTLRRQVVTQLGLATTQLHDTTQLSIITLLLAVTPFLPINLIVRLVQKRIRTHTSIPTSEFYSRSYYNNFNWFHPQLWNRLFVRRILERANDGHRLQGECFPHISTWITVHLLRNFRAEPLSMSRPTLSKMEGPPTTLTVNLPANHLHRATRRRRWRTQTLTSISRRITQLLVNLRLSRNPCTTIFPPIERKRVIVFISPSWAYITRV